MRFDLRELRRQWEHSALRPISLSLALVVLGFVLFLGLSPYLLGLAGHPTQCVTTTTEITSAGGGVPNIHEYTTVKKCSPYHVPFTAMWVGAALFGLLALIEIGTLLPGLVIETPFGKISNHAYIEDVEEIAPTEVVEYQQIVSDVGPYPAGSAPTHLP